jgi:hypothetical protein
MMLAYNVQLPFEGQEAEHAYLLCRTLEQAQRVSRAQNDALILLVDVIDSDMIEFLLSEDCDATIEEYLAWRKQQVN